ncbi:MAG TPA: hypothetical protein VFE60_11985 [Roseiarcus sp.]|nr:hypothetical protein [Roseiarcus sp.]
MTPTRVGPDGKSTIAPAEINQQPRLWRLGRRTQRATAHCFITRLELADFRRRLLFARRRSWLKPRVASAPRSHDFPSHNGAAFAKLQPDVGQGRAGRPQFGDLIVGH